MPLLRATAVLNTRSGTPRDASRNVWHFHRASGALTDGEVTAIGTQLGAFYNRLATYLSSVVSPATDAHRIELADVTAGFSGPDDDTVSALRGTVPFTIPTTTTTPGYPAEVAIVLAFQGATTGIPEEESGGLIRPRSRRRGRVYLGPVNTSCGDVRDAVGYEIEVRDPVKETILDSYDTMHDALVTLDVNIRHCVYSRADAVPYPVIQTSVNNEFDTVRRRTRKATNRYIRAVGAGLAVGSRSGTEFTITV